ncbi:MAG: hypothetical protein OJF58_003857 [Enhydrobacter sp.]|nr:MAG: hypothetical protein OJF58_003857 [Enhydrobacter sp.]
MSRKKPGHRRGSLATILFVLIALCAGRAGLAEEAWVFASEIPCSSAPVYGLPFNQCWISNVRSFRMGNVQSWRLLYADSKSESEVGLYSIVAARGSGGLPPVAPGAGMIDWIRTADALKNVTAGGTGWAMSGGAARQPYLTFQKPGRQCLAFVRNGPGQRWLLGAAFCREAATAISADEAAFIADAIQVRQ